jgi:segregation and condensation protein B
VLNSQQKLRNIVEALLFASDAPLRIKDLHEILPGYRKEDISEALVEIVELYQSPDRSLQLIEVAEGYQFTSKPEYHRWIRDLRVKSRERQLSGPSLETLAIIAYKQPVSRAEIERIRGVNVDSVLQNLLRRNLIRIAGREKGIGRALLYATTRDFLVQFGLRDLKDLPSVEEVERLFKPLGEIAGIHTAEDDEIEAREIQPRYQEAEP